MSASVKRYNDDLKGVVAIDTSLWVDFALAKENPDGREEPKALFERILEDEDIHGLISDVVVSEFIHVIMKIRIVNECKRMVKDGKILPEMVDKYKNEPKRFYHDYPGRWRKVISKILDDEVEPLLNSSLINYV